MGATQGIRAGRAFVELGVADKLTKRLEKAQARLKAFGEGLQRIGKGLASLGGSVLAPIMLGVKAFTEGGDAIAKMSKRTGIGVSALSELAFAADLCAVDLETLETGVRKMQKTLAEAATGSAGATQALGYLNLTVADLANLNHEQQLKLIADRLAAIKDPTVRAALAMSGSSSGAAPASSASSPAGWSTTSFGRVKHHAYLRAVDRILDATAVHAKALDVPVELGARIAQEFRVIRDRTDSRPARPSLNQLD